MKTHLHVHVFTEQKKLFKRKTISHTQIPFSRPLLIAWFCLPPKPKKL